MKAFLFLKFTKRYGFMIANTCIYKIFLEDISSSGALSSYKMWTECLTTKIHFLVGRVDTRTTIAKQLVGGKV